LTQTDKTALLRAAVATDGGTEMQWLSSLEMAKAAAALNDEPYGIFFCTESVARVAGESDETRAAYKQAHSGVLPEKTPFDSKNVRDWLALLGIRRWVKVADTAENRTVFERYGASPNTILFLSPDGTTWAKLSGQQTQENAVIAALTGDVLRQFERYANAAKERALSRDGDGQTEPERR